MKVIFFTILAILFTFELSAQDTKIETIYFDYDKYSLTKEATTTLENFYSEIKDEEFSRITIIGHTDADGNNEYNTILSKNRTKTITNYFLLKGLSKNKIKIQFYGENKPIANNDNEQDKQKNRRVEIIVEKEKIKANKDFEKQPQFFLISSNKDTSIICNERTIIKIKANSFASDNDTLITERIKLSITEYYKISDILLSNLSTTSNGKLLETGGMLNIIATKNNEPIKLKNGKTIEISFPTNKKEKDMQLFSGLWENDNHINWSTQKSTDKDNQQIYMTVEEMPTFVGGEKKLFNFLSYTVKYPEKAKELGVQGTVYVSFVINENGKVIEPRVVRGVTSELDLAALDAIKKMPNWTPGKQKGQNVSVQFTLPVKFNLGDTSLVGEGTFKERFEQSYKDTTIQKASSGNIMYYVFNSTDLGWINCDRFINISPKVDYIVKLDKNVETAKIIFDRYKSVMNVYPVNGTYSFKNVPLGEKITIVAIKRIDNKPYLAVKETKTSSQVEKELNFKPVTIEMLKTEMKKLDKFN